MSLLLIALTVAATQSWEQLGVSPGGTTYYDPASTVILDAAKRRVRVRNLYHEARPNGVASSILVAEIDCVNLTGTLLEMQHLDAVGTVIETQTVPFAQRQTLPTPLRGGPEAAELLRLCGNPAQ